MLGPIEDALGDQTSPLASEQRERLTIAHRNALRLLKLVNTLLEFSRIEAGRVQAAFEPVDLSALTSDLASNFRSLCERASLRLMINCPTLTEPVYIDTEMWEKIVLNLVSNAFKFTFEGEIEVSLHAIDNAVELSVRDTGTGIPAHELPHLFKRFHRIEGAQGRTYEGSGIGLALVQELAKLHGGTLNVESAQGKGSIFRLRIPFGNGHLPQDQIRSARNIPATAANATSFIEEALRSLPDVLATHTANGNELGFSEKSALSPAVNDAERPCVLLADDNADMRAYIARVLTEGGYDVRPFSDGLMALHAIRDGLRPDLVLSDIMMPRLDGFGLLRELRSDPTLENLLVIFLSARAGEEARIEGIAAGADDYLLKPFGARELRARVDGAIRLGRLRREAAIRERELEAEIIRQGGRAALHESETRRRISEEKYQLLMEHARDAILTVNSDGEVLELNRQAELLFGRSRDEIVGRLFNSFSEASDFNRFRADTAKLIESRLIRTDEDRIDTEISSARVVIDGEEIVVLIIRDITERLLLEQKLGRAQKMEAIGQLTGGVAHDFNNLLTVILSNADTLAEELEGNADLRALAEMTRTAAERGADLTQSLLAFARRQALEPQVLDVNTLVAGMEGLLRRTLGDNIQISLVQSPDTRRAIVDSAQLESAILNLSINARDAMPNGGQLTIETGNAQLDQAYADVNDEVNAGDYVLLCVSDTGTGMPPEVAARAFDPFFSTKDVGKGTGLGLSMVYGFVKQSGGHIKIYSEMGLGTSFRIYLPLAHQTQSIADVQSTRKVVDPIGTETILLVEDDDLVREHSERVVRSLGYRVLVASSGPSGMEIVKSGEHIDLLFTDVVMPGGMTGRQLAALAMEGLPNLKVLFTSGYNENVILHHGQLDPGVHLLRKPYRKRDLALKLRQLLE